MLSALFQLVYRTETPGNIILIVVEMNGDANPPVPAPHDYTLIYQLPGNGGSVGTPERDNTRREFGS